MTFGTLWMRTMKKMTKSDYSLEIYDFFEPPFNLHSELTGLKEYMCLFFPYLSHRNSMRLNLALKEIDKIIKDIEIE